MRFRIFDPFISLMPYQPVTIQFHALLTPLSGYFSAFAHATNSLSVIGICLDLDVDPPIFVLHFQGALLFAGGILKAYPTGLSPSTALCSKRLWITSRMLACASQHHIFSVLLQSIRFDLSGFRSLLLTGSQLISLPAATKMFQFTA